MKNLLFAIICCFLAVSCGSAKKTSVLFVSTPLPSDAPVEIIGIGQKVKENAKLIGQISIGESGMTATKNCTYDKVIEQAQIQARAIGANLLQITKHKEPTALGSSCHALKCDAYLVK